MKNETLLKYPVTYKDGEYEVDMEITSYGSIDGIAIYKPHLGIFKKKKRNLIYVAYRDDILDKFNDLDIRPNSPTKYIDAIKITFQLYEENERRKEAQAKRDLEYRQAREKRAQKLAEWDGVIS